MRSFERHAMILSVLATKEHATIEELALACDTSPQTIRRDLNQLGFSGQVTRFHGGAMLPLSRPATSYDAHSNLPEKEVLAKTVAQLLSDNTSLFLAGGSTLALVANSLKKRQGMTVVTNNLPAAISLLENKSFEVHVVGGLARAASCSIAGERAVEFIERFKVDTALIGTSGIDADGTLLSYDHSLVLASKAMIANSRRKILVADATKFNGGGVVRGLHLRDFDLLVTDRTLNKDAEALVSESGIQMLLAGRD